MILDIRTFYLLLTVGNIVMFGALMIFAKFSRLEGSLRLYAYAKLLQGLGMLMVFRREMFLGDFFIIMESALFFAGIFIEAFCLIYVGKKPVKRSMRIWSSGAVALIAAFSFLQIIAIKTWIIICLYAAIFGATSTFIGIQLVFYNNDTKLKRFFGYFFLCMAIPHVIRGGDILVNHKGYVIFGSYFIQIAVLVFSYIHMLSSTMAYLLMSREIVDMELKLAATTDFLTGVANRMQFTSLAKRMFSLEIREAKSVALLMFDIDNFKSINDSYGHPMGDRVLVHFATTISDTVRTEDIFARYGGEEFILMLPHTAIEEAEVIANRCKAVIARRLIEDNGIPSYTVSIGIAAMIPDNLAQLDTLIDQADQALLYAKKQGKNQFVKYTELV